MYNASTIISSFVSLLGWRQNDDVNGWQIDAPLTTSDTGLYYNNFHPLLTVDNLISICPEFDRLSDNTVQADIDADFTTWLKRKTEDGILGTIDDWLDLKFQSRTASNLLDYDKLFNQNGNFTDLSESIDNAVGIEIKPTNSMSMVTVIKEIGVQFTDTQTVTINLFRTGTLDPIETVAINYTAEGGTVQWETVNWEIDSNNGAYYLVYDGEALEWPAINGVKQYDYTNRGITSFPSGRYLQITAFNVNENDINELFDLSLIEYSVDTNHGINLKLTTKCNYTNFITDQKELFKTAIGLRVAMNLLREFAFNPQSRINRNQSNISRAEVLYEINGDTQGRNDSTLYARYQKALNSISFDAKGLDKICLPCKKKGVAFKNIGPRR